MTNPASKNSSPTPESDKSYRHFIHDISDGDLRTSKWGGRVHTRFPPEPNRYLHIGHAKSICLNFGLAQEYPASRCHMRFDDTNPVAEDVEYVDSILADVRWLGFDWGTHLHFTSDYFEQLYGFAVQVVASERGNRTTPGTGVISPMVYIRRRRRWRSSWTSTGSTSLTTPSPSCGCSLRRHRGSWW